MAKPYSNDLRQRVAAAIASGDSCRAIAEHYAIAPSTVVKWSKRVRETGSAAPAKFGGHRTCTLEPHRDFLLAQLEAVPHLTLHKLKDMLAARGITRVARYGVALPATPRPLLQKKPHSPVSNIAPTSPGAAGAGSGQSVVSIRSASSSSMRPGSRPTWPRSAAGASKASG
jgi:transposase